MSHEPPDMPLSTEPPRRPQHNDLPVRPADPNAGFRTALVEARRRLAHETELAEQAARDVERHATEKARLRRVISSLAAMLGEPAELESIGITEACRAVMAEATVPLKLRNVCELLSDVGFDPKTQNNLEASVQVVLNRLADKTEISKQQIASPNGKQITVYIGPKVSKAQMKQTVHEIVTGQSV